jgi:hypothetical protein
VGIAAIKPIVDGTTSQQKQAAELNISNSGIVATIPFSQSLRLGTLRIQDSFSFKSIFHSRQMNI